MSRKGLKAYEYSQDEAVRLLFPPVHGNDPQSAAAQVQGVCYRSPQLYELPRSRWSLALLQKTIPWLAGKSLSCISQLLKRLHVSYKRGRRALHSPDLLYDVKLARIRAAYQQMHQQPTPVVLLYLDEHLVGRYRSGQLVGAYQRACASCAASPSEQDPVVVSADLRTLDEPD